MESELRWRPYFLNPKLTAEGIEKRVAYGKRMGEAGVAKMEKSMKRMFADEGISYTLDGQMSSTLNSHRLMELAHLQGGAKLQDELAEILFRNYF